MAGPVDDPAMEKPLLQRLYETGHHSDLTIRTSTRDFHVHKCVVCEECPFFAGAIRGQWKEVQTGIIDVEESEAVMDVLFQYMYKIDIDIVPREGDSPQQLSDKAKGENFHLALDVETAANKYLLAGIDSATFPIMDNCVWRAGVMDLVAFAKALLVKNPDDISDCLVFSVLRLGSAFQELLGSKGVWAELHSDPRLQKLVVQCAHIRERRVRVTGTSILSDADIALLRTFFKEAGLSLPTTNQAQRETRRRTTAFLIRGRKGGDEGKSARYSKVRQIAKRIQSTLRGHH